MMAESIPFSIAEKILLQLGSAAFQQIALIVGAKDEVRKLCNTLTAIKAVLLDADEQQEKSLLVQNWIENLKDVVYDADDILDACSTRAPKTEPYFFARMKAQVGQFFSSSNQLTFRYNIGKKIRNIRERLDEIASDMAKFNFRERSFTVRVRRNEREQTHSYVLSSNVAGREEDKEEMVKLLLTPSDQENVSAMAIVGMGGLGKTTLAKLVYNDERIVRNFELRIWISVYDEFNVISVIEKILASSRGVENLEMDEEKKRLFDKKAEMEQLQFLIREKLDGKKYLLVMDDVWNENREIWIQLSELLIGGGRGSKIVATTRSQRVAFAMDAECMHMLQGLTEDASWSLFKHLAFRNGQEGRHPNLVKVGKNIVKKCRGVPLAIRTLGSMLRSITEENAWLSVQNSEIWELHDIMKILKLSYDQLPSSLKQCFIYCSLFPKGYEFDVGSLIQLWMAQDYINRIGMGEQLEEIGAQYFEELWLRSFFQDVKRDDNGNITSCRIHDLMHDLACSIAKPENCVAEPDGRNISERVKHVSFATYLPLSWIIPPSLSRVKNIRTFLLPLQNQRGCMISVEVMCACFQCLRVLDLHGQRIENLPRAIGKLIHLRNLDLSKNLLTTLPSSISKLQNLEIDKCSKLTRMPPRFGKLTALRTLPRFVLGKSSSTSKCSGLGELYNLNNIL